MKKIRTNNKPRRLSYLWELPEKWQAIIANLWPNPDAGRYFLYKGSYFRIEQFLPDDAFPEWTGRLRLGGNTIYKRISHDEIVVGTVAEAKP